MTTELFQFQLKHALLAFYVVIFYYLASKFSYFCLLLKIQFGRLTKQAQINTEDDKTVLAELKKTYTYYFKVPKIYKYKLKYSEPKTNDNLSREKYMKKKGR